MLVVRSVYYCIVFLCIGISLYLTYFGFLRTFNELTLPFTIVIGLVLFAADYLVQRYREAGRSVMLPLALFLIGAAFSSVSNFNFLYTNFMTRDVAAQTLREEYEVFRDDLVKTRAKLTGLAAVQSEAARRDRIETELLNMYKQATDPGRPGCGQRCREHIASINSSLSTPPTDLQISSAASAFDGYFERYSQLVYAALDAEPSASVYVSVRTMQRDIEAALTQFSSPQDAIQTVGLGVLGAMSDVSQDIERRANALLADTQRVSHHMIDPSAGRLGEIVYTLKNGFVDRPNMSATILSVVAGSIVDWLPIIYAMIAFRRGVNLGGVKESNRHEGLL